MRDHLADHVAALAALGAGHEHEPRIRVEAELPASFGPRTWCEQIRVEAVRYDSNVEALHKGCAFGESGKPPARCHDRRVERPVDRLLDAPVDPRAVSPDRRPRIEMGTLPAAGQPPVGVEIG